MQLFRGVSPIATAAIVAVVLFSSASAYAVEFEASVVTPSGVFLLTGVGELYRVRADAPPTKVLTFQGTNKLPFHWTNPPKSAAQWKSRWFVADMSNHIARFSMDGIFAESIDAPVRVAKLAVTPEALWAVNPLALNATDQLWRSTDGRTFSAVRASTSEKHFDSPAENMLILNGGVGGDLCIAAVVGPPVARCIRPDARRYDVHLAYSRTRFRAGLEEIIGIIDDVQPYSLPVRDLMPLDHGELVVLRNREEVRVGKGRIDILRGRRADRYGGGGLQRATAIFPRSVHWIVAVTPSTITGISRTGELATATWGPILPGEIISP